VIDVPFGPPAAVAVAAGWNTWGDYLVWSASNGEPEILRDRLRDTLKQKGVPWSTKRHIDATICTTWFPFFEMLYRQTITGARDVLSSLDQAERDKVRVLPFHEFASAHNRLSVVIEGFPGWTLTQNDLPSRGYKGKDSDSEKERRRIVDALCERGIPISEQDRDRAVRDDDGDAVDALVLLHAARTASQRTADQWKQRAGEHAAIEGWFFD